MDEDSVAETSEAQVNKISAKTTKNFAAKHSETDSAEQNPQTGCSSDGGHSIPDSEDAILSSIPHSDPTVLSHNQDQDQGCSTDDHDVERMQWSGRFDFVLSCIGYAVGLGNAWRFPYMVFKHGGGAFMLPYTVFLIFGGVPLVFLEIGLGQYSSLGPLQVWRCVPLFKGVGACMVLLSCAVAVYYNVILSWITFYLISSSHSPLPWSSCNNTWNTPACCERPYYPQNCSQFLDGNITNSNDSCVLCLANTENNTAHDSADVLIINTDVSEYLKTVNNASLTTPSQEFFFLEVLNISNNLRFFGAVQWELALTLLCVWTFIFCSLCLGIRSSGKVVYITTLVPYFVMFVLLVYTSTLEGARKGLIFFLQPNWKSLRNAKLWTDAASQVLFSLSPGYGGLITLASYNRFYNNCYRDSIIVIVCNVLTSLLSGTIVFSALGHLSHLTNLSVEQVAHLGPDLGLVFITYPSIFNQSNTASNFFAISFFLMLLSLGIDTQFVYVNTVVTAVVDIYPRKLNKYRIFVLLACCITLYLLGLLLTARNGAYMVQILDSYVMTWAVLLTAMLECIAMAWVYGAERFRNDMYLMTGTRPGRLWSIAWKFATPLSITFLVIFTIVQRGDTDLVFQTLHTQPAEMVKNSGLLALIPIIAILITLPLVTLFTQDGKWKERLRFLVTTPKSWDTANAYRREDHNLGLPEYMISEKEEGLDNPAFQVNTAEGLWEASTLYNRFINQDNIDTGSLDWEDDENHVRGNWTGRYDFLFSGFGFCVGIGNVWRFPYLVYKNGGGAFFIPYILMLFLCGLPLFFMEVAFGQFASLGAISIWKVCPIFKGVGISSIISAGLVAIYYNVMNSWSVYFLFASMTTDLPWTHCNNSWNTENCRERDNMTTQINLENNQYEIICQTDNLTEDESCFNLTTNSTSLVYTYPSEEYFMNEVMGMTNGVEDIGNIQWHLCLCLLFCWLVVFAALFRGVKSAGKVVYVTATFPYIILVILFIRYATLDSSGYLDGIKYFVTPNWKRLASAEVWADAASQLFFSLSLSQGGLITLSSYNRFHYDVYRDTYLICLVDTLTSVLAGFVIFAILGVMAQESGTDVEHVVSSKFTLAYVAYPEAVTRLPAAFIWAVLFFLMLFTLAVDTVFFMCEAIVVALMDEFQVLAKRRLWIIAALCLSFYLLGLPMVTQGGLYLVVLMDHYAAAWGPLIIGLCMCLSLSWVYKANHFAANIRVMLGSSPGMWWIIMWKFVTPLSLAFILVFSWVEYSPPTVSEYEYPMWAQRVGILTGVVSIIIIPIVSLWDVSKKGYASILERFKQESRPHEEWGPALQKHRQSAFIPGVINESEVKRQQTEEWVTRTSDVIIGVTDLASVFHTRASKSMEEDVLSNISESKKSSKLSSGSGLNKKIQMQDKETQTEISRIKAIKAKEMSELSHSEAVASTML